MINRWKQLTVVASLAALCFLSAGQVVQAEQLSVNEKMLREWDNGTKVSAKLDTKGSIEITTSTEGLKKGYYSAYVYDLHPRDWSDVGLLSFSIRNESEQELPLNVVITRADNVSVTVSDERNVIVVEKATGETRVVHPESGLIKLAPGFVGQVRIPFNSLMVQNKKNTTGQVKLGKVMSWGITTTTAQDNHLKFRVGNIKPVGKEQANTEKKLSSLRLVGDERVVKPEVGESIAQYTVVDATAKEAEPLSGLIFSLADPAQGVSISPDGLLSLNTDAQADSITIRAIVDGKWQLDFPVMLDRSTALNVQEKDGTTRSIPAPDQVTKVLDPANPLMKPGVMWLIRIALVLLGASALFLYWLWRRKPSKRRTKSKLSRAERKARRPFSM